MITKRGMQRKEMIARIEQLENALMSFIRRLHNIEIVIEQYVEMNEDSEKFNNFLESKMKESLEKQEEKPAKKKKRKKRKPKGEKS